MQSLEAKDIEAIRKQFPIFQGKEDFIYLDTAATAHKPKCVMEACEKCYAQQYATVHRSVYGLAMEATSTYERVRQRVCAFLHASSPEEIVFTKSTTEAINLVARSLGSTVLTPGSEVLISLTEHHSNIVPWQWICKERGAELKVIPITSTGELDREALEELLTERTKIVSIAHIANTTGTVHPIEYIAKAAHKKGAVVLVDGAQSASHMPVDVQKMGCDFFTFSGHKAYGPTGIGVLFGRLPLLKAMPPYQGGGDMIEEVTFEQSTFQPPPLRFEAGTPPISQVFGLNAAIEFIESVGRERIAAWENRLLQYAMQKLMKIPGLRIVGTSAHKGAIISFTVEEAHPLDLATLLDAKGVALRSGHMCAQPTLQHFGLSSLLRVSFGIYNTLPEIDRFVFLLEQAINVLKSGLIRV